MFEVEYKFKIPANFESILREHGWAFLNEIHFVDTYFDSELYRLTLNEHWLRRRDTKWQLKYCTSPGNGTDSVRIDKFNEVSDESEIHTRLASLLNVDEKSLPLDSKVTSDVVKALGLKPIAEFETFRGKYKLGAFTIDLDRTNFGYELGEIELTCEKQSEMESAASKIYDMANKLEFGPVPTI
ncbi:thiamine-triphosphatase-like [Dendronephthya gigantea]|uniref:thiamine-triphosphatase-like n=1 Tax=Dendronephthya gigantea TaxID=151771 RepID=UPI00106929FC|nr:thiamine-triphosphatase-like [Dendronephthya gigantea]